MKLLQKITLLLIGAIFLLSSSGYVLYKSSCLCTGEEQTSVFIKPETCTTHFHEHHQHIADRSEQTCSADECHDCSDSADDCGCNQPTVFFFKLLNDVTKESVKYIKTQPVVIEVAKLKVDERLTPKEDITFEEDFYPDSPPLKASSLDFLVEIQQLKIPSLTA
jgi:hypothetical protein